MTAGRRPFVHRAGWCVLVAAVVCLVFGYTRSRHAYCPRCWAILRFGEVGLALTPDLRVAFHRHVDLPDGPQPAIARFLPPDHVHDTTPPGGSSGMSGPYLSGSTDCLRSAPSEFAMALLFDGGFADHVAARVAAGAVDIETVRRLIAVPSPGKRDGWHAEGGHAALMRAGTELWAAWKSEDPERARLWLEDLPPAAPCPNLHPGDR